MIDSFKTSGYKAGAVGSIPAWDIVFDGVDFQAMTGYATIVGPISLIIDVDASLVSFPTYYGIEIRTVDRSISLTDNPQIAFVPTGERRTITSGSVPQLAHITGEITAIIIHCFGFTALDAQFCKIAVRVGPTAPLTAPLTLIGRGSMVLDPGVIFGGSGSQSIAANTSNVNLFTLVVPAVNNIRYRLTSVQITLAATPSYAGDLIGHIRVVNKSLTTLEVLTGTSDTDGKRTYIYPVVIILDLACKLLIEFDNLNPAVAYTAQYAVYFELIY